MKVTFNNKREMAPNSNFCYWTFESVFEDLDLSFFLSSVVTCFLDTYAFGYTLHGWGASLSSDFSENPDFEVRGEVGGSRTEVDFSQLEDHLYNNLWKKANFDNDYEAILRSKPIAKRLVERFAMDFQHTRQDLVAYTIRRGH